jgi:hypothetical protein
MRRTVAAAVIAAGLGVAGGARAHVAPSTDVNNRYVKLTLLGDRVRLAYTVYYGEVPGAAQRRTLDANHDGALAPAESDAAGQALGRQVAPAIEVTVDGKVVPTSWALVDVGLGTPDVRAGAFSVDLVAWYCLGGGATHAVVLRDRFALPHAGETEVRIEDGPGVRVASARLGDLRLPDLDARWEGPGGPIVREGLEVQFEAGPQAQRMDDGRCGGDGRTGDGDRWRWPVAVSVTAAVAAAAAVAVTRLRRRRAR